MDDHHSRKGVLEKKENSDWVGRQGNYDEQGRKESFNKGVNREGRG